MTYTNDLKLVNEMFTKGKTEAFYFFLNHKEELKDWRFIGCEPFGKNEIAKNIQTKTLENNTYLINFFKYPYLYFIESKTLEKEMAYYYLDSSVSLDTQILSYMERFLLENQNAIPNGFFKTIDYLLTNKINVDPFEYLFENKADWERNEEKIEKTWYTYEIFKTADINTWQKEKVLKSNKSSKEILSTTHENKRKLEQFLEKTNDFRENIFDICYALLLEMCLVELRNPKKSSENKLKIFLEYTHSVLGFLPHREIIIAKEYFEKGHNLAFFKKINTQMKQPLKVIKNMAWDLTHLRNIERKTLSFTLDDVYFIPCLLTMDKALAEIASLCSFRMVAINQKKRQMVVCYDEIKKLNHPELYIKWFNEEMFQKRKPIKKIKDEILTLESQILELMKE